METRLDFQNITSLFIKSVRGDQTQEALSHELEANFNIVNRWETGQRGFYWNDFISLARLKGWNLSEALTKVTHFKFSEWPASEEVLTEILLPSSREILKNYFSPQKIARLSGGRSKLLFDDFLTILEAVYGRAERFLNHFLPENQTSYFAPAFSQKDQHRERIGQDPFLSLVRFALSLESYRSLPAHSDQCMADLLKISPQEVRSRLNVLEELGVIQKEGEHFVTSREYLDTGAKSPDTSRRVGQFWRQKISEYVAHNLELGQMPNLTSAHLIYGTNPELDEKVFEICRKFYIDVKNIVAAYENAPKDNIRYLNIDLFYPLGRDIKGSPSENT